MILDNVAINSLNSNKGITVKDGGKLSGDRVQMTMQEGDAGGATTNSASLLLGSINGVGQSTLDLTNSRINLDGPLASALLANGSVSTATFTDSAIIAADSNVINASQNADLTINASGSNLAGKTLLLAGTGNTGDNITNVTLNGDNGSVFSGDVQINRDAVGTNAINLDNNSLWSGSTTTLQNLSLSNGSQWDVTQSSAIDSVTLDNGTLNMTAPDTGYSLVTVGNLTSNNGTVNFKTHLMDDGSLTDQLHITGDYNGNTNVVVSNAGGTGARTIDGIQLVNVDGELNGTFTQQGRIVAGAYDYNLVQSGKQLLLETDVSKLPVDPTGPVIPVDPVKPVDPASPETPEAGSGAGAETPAPAKVTHIVRPEAASYAANLAASNTLFSTSLDDRLGETSYIDALGQQQVTSLWLRNEGGHSRVSDSSGQLKTTGNRYVMQLGGDVAQWSSNGADRFHLGVMGGYANARSNTHSNVTHYNSKAEVSGYSAGVYGSWFQDSAEKTGAWVDSWALYNWFDNIVKGQDISEESYKSKGFTASVESGYTFKVGELNERQSYYLQPKAQITWMGVEADDHVEHNGTRVTGEGNNNLQTSLGVRAFIKGHNKIDDGKQRTFEPFIEANWIHNTQQFGSNMNGVSLSQAGTSNIGEVKVGVDAKLNNKVNLWSNIGQQMGDKGYSDSSAMVGLKVNF